MSEVKKLKDALYPLKKWLQSLFIYLPLKWRSAGYDHYWHHRKLTAQTPLNSFQRKRADLVLRYIKENSSVLDIGAGNGRVLLYVDGNKPLSKMIAADISKDALEMARENGIQTIEVDISKMETFKDIPATDYIFMFEILEHIPNSEEMLEWAVLRARKGVFFSVPNTGFIFHRLRLLFGRFPLQWRLSPSEHLRFWTLRDMKWWLRESGYKTFEPHTYEGVPLLNNIWPGLFAEGLFVYIPKIG